MEFYIFVIFIISLLIAMLVYLYFRKSRWTPYTYGIFNGHRYVYHMTIYMSYSEPLKFDLYGYENYKYPDEVLKNLHNNWERHKYIIDLGDEVLFIREKDIQSMRMTMTDTQEQERMVKDE